MLDKRLGKIEGTDTKVCAVTGQPVSAGMIRYSLGNGYYFRVMPRAQRLVTDEFIQTMADLIPTKTSSKKVAANTTKTSEDVDNDS